MNTQWLAQRPVDPDEGETRILPLVLEQVDEVGLSEIGRQRDHNEDFLIIDSRFRRLATGSGYHCHLRGLYVLCDGMGGHAAGEIASRRAAEVFRAEVMRHWPEQGLPPDACLRRALAIANQDLFDRNEAAHSEGRARMGTTLVALLLTEQQGVIVHVGDSRAYRYRRRQGLECLTEDHQVGQAAIHQGVEAAIALARPEAYQLTQALGPRESEDLEPAIRHISLDDSQLLLLCSDGLSDHELLPELVESHLAPMARSQSHLPRLAQDLMDLANDCNGHDNLSLIAVRLILKPLRLTGLEDEDDHGGG